LKIKLWFITILLVDTTITKNAGDFGDAAGEREMSLKCGSRLGRSADRTGQHQTAPDRTWPEMTDYLVYFTPTTVTNRIKA